MVVAMIASMAVGLPPYVHHTLMTPMTPRVDNQQKHAHQCCSGISCCAAAAHMLGASPSTVSFAAP